MKPRLFLKTLKGRLRTGALPQLHRLAAPLIRVRRSLRPPKVSLFKVEAAAPNNSPLSILCGLTGQTKHFFLGLEFGDAPRETPFGKFSLPKIFRAPHTFDTDASILAIETKPTHHAWLDDGTWFFLPNWVSGDAALPIPEHFLRTESVKSDFRKIRKHGYEYEVTRDEAKLRHFYDHMHLPYVGKIHGNEACLDSYEEKRARAEECDLLLVKKQGVAVSGILIVYETAGPRLWSLGVLDGDLALAREAVMPALYHFSADHLLKKGFTKMHLGSSRPFLNNGLIKFKRKMSQTLTGNSWPGFAMKILKLDNATKKFLEQNPFIFCTKDGLGAAVFTGEELFSETRAQFEKDYFYPGLKKLVIYSFRDEVTAPIFSTTPAGPVEIRSARELV